MNKDIHLIYEQYATIAEVDELVAERSAASRKRRKKKMRLRNKQNKRAARDAARPQPEPPVLKRQPPVLQPAKPPFDPEKIYSGITTAREVGRKGWKKAKAVGRLARIKAKKAAGKARQAWAAGAPKRGGKKRTQPPVLQPQPPVLEPQPKEYEQGELFPKGDVEQPRVPKPATVQPDLPGIGPVDQPRPKKKRPLQKKRYRTPPRVRKARPVRPDIPRTVAGVTRGGRWGARMQQQQQQQQMG